MQGRDGVRASHSVQYLPVLTAKRQRIRGELIDVKGRLILDTVAPVTTLMACLLTRFSRHRRESHAPGRSAFLSAVGQVNGTPSPTCQGSRLDTSLSSKATTYAPA